MPITTTGTYERITKATQFLILVQNPFENSKVRIFYETTTTLDGETPRTESRPEVEVTFAEAAAVNPAIAEVLTQMADAFNPDKPAEEEPDD